MRLVLVSMNFAPEITGVGKYSGEMAERLVDLGHDVTVVCAPPYYPYWRVEDGYAATRYRIERPRPGLTIHRCPVWVPRRATGINRLLHLASFAASSLPVLLRLARAEPAVVMAVAPALPAAFGAWLAARLGGARAWLHVQDFEVDAAFGLGLLGGGLIRRAMQAIERGLLRRFDRVSTISERMLSRVAAKGVAASRTELVPNWVDLAAIRPGDRSPALRASLGIAADAVVCLYAGTMNRKHGLRVLIDAAVRLRERDDIVVVLCGDGEQRAELATAAQGLANVRVIDLRPADELNALLNMADLHLLPQLQGAADLVMPSKLTGMLASGRPVLAAVPPESEIAALLDGCGVTVEPESAAGFAAAIVALAGDAARRAALGRGARARAERTLGADAVIAHLDRRLHELCDVPHEPQPARLAATPLGLAVRPHADSELPMAR